MSSFSDYTVWLSVWNYEAWKKNTVLGDIHIPLSDLNLEEDTHKQWYTLNVCCSSHNTIGHGICDIWM